MRLLSSFACCLMVCALIGCGSEAKPGDNRLVGKITVNGQPAPYVMIIVTGPDGTETGGQANDDGTYIILDPPQGELKFHFVDMSPKKRGKKSIIPPKYTKPGNGIRYEFGSGEETFDIKL